MSAHGLESRTGNLASTTLSSGQPRFASQPRLMARHSGPTMPPGSRPAEGRCATSWHSLSLVRPGDVEAVRDTAHALVGVLRWATHLSALRPNNDPVEQEFN